MSPKIKKLLFIACLLTALFASAHFALAGVAVTGFGSEPGGTQADVGKSLGLGSSDPRIVVARIINIALGFLGIIAVGLIIYAGWLWMTAGGEAQKIEKAKKILIGAVIGLLIILASFALVSYILARLIDATGGGPGGPPGGGPPGGGASRGASVINTSPKDGTIMLPQNTKEMFYFDYGIDVK